MAQHSTAQQSVEETLKSPGSWFLTGNAALNAQTHPLIAFGYAALFVTQRMTSHYWREKVNNPIAKFILGPQGPLFLNAVITTLVGSYTAACGSPILAKACFAFSGANVIQSLVYWGTIKFGSSKPATVAKNSTVAACEIAILYGLSKVAENAGFDPATAATMVTPGVVFALTRAFKPKLLPPSLAYMDMMVVAIATGVMAISMGVDAAVAGDYLNPFILNATSRVLAFGAFTRLAVNRAQFDGRKTIFEVERWAPTFAQKVKSKITFLKNEV